MAKLTLQQKRRIAENRDTRARNVAQNAVVVAHLGFEVVVELDGGELLVCDFRQNLGEIAVNDRVSVQKETDNRGRIEAIAKRVRSLSKWQKRRAKIVASNVDKLLICLAIIPEIQWPLVDRFLIAAKQAEIDCALMINKMDLADVQSTTALNQMLDPYQRLGIKVFFERVCEGVSADLRLWLQNMTTVLCGQSGVGKSSLIKQLVPDADIWIQALSQAHLAGKHTTTNLRRYPMDKHTFLIDTPGVRGFALAHLSPSEVLAGFPEIAQIASACRFNDCQHQAEPDCAVREGLASGAISQARYQSLLQLIEEFKS